MLAGTAPAFPQDEQARRALDALVASYSEAVAGHDGEVLRWSDGTVMPVSSMRASRASAAL